MTSDLISLLMGLAVGRGVPMFQGTDIDAVTSLNQLIYVSPYHRWGGAIGADALLPNVDLDSAFSRGIRQPLTRGYWAKIAAGDSIQRPDLPERADLGSRAIAFRINRNQR